MALTTAALPSPGNKHLANGQQMARERTKKLQTLTLTMNSQHTWLKQVTAEDALLKIYVAQ